VTAAKKLREPCRCGDDDETPCRRCVRVQAMTKDRERWIDSVNSYVRPRGVQSFEFVWRGKVCKAVSFRQGRLEMYEIGPGGLEMFAGYLRDVLGTVDARTKPPV
jgi:hypothetical protein